MGSEMCIRDRIRATHPEKKWRNGKQAVELAERCCQLTNNRFAKALDALAAAYAETGRFEDAEDAQIKAIELTPQAMRAEQMARLRLYMAKKPFRENPNPASK